MALKPIGGEIKSQDLNDNFSYLDERIVEGGTDPELEGRVTAVETGLASHKAEGVLDGVHGMGRIASQDYEEGIWTPELRFGGAATGIAYSTRFGRYTKIGRVIHWELEIVLSNKGTATGVATMHGLPFLSNPNNPRRGYAVEFFSISLPEGVTSLVLSHSINVAAMAIRGVGNDIPDNSLNDANFKNNSIFRGMGMYTI